MAASIACSNAAGAWEIKYGGPAAPASPAGPMHQTRRWVWGVQWSLLVDEVGMEARGAATSLLVDTGGAPEWDTVSILCWEALYPGGADGARPSRPLEPAVPY